MSKKTLILCICILLMLLAAIGFGVGKLYSGKPAKSSPENAVSHSSLLQAVPADAALVFCFQNARSGSRLLESRTHCLRSLLGGNIPFDRFLAGIRDSVSLKGLPLAVSVHYSETLVPLMILETGHAADTSEYERALMERAAACGVQTALRSGEEGVRLLLASPSLTLVESSCRHLESGTSVLDDPYFAEMAGSVGGREVLYLSNGYLGKMISSLCRKPLYGYSTFLKGAAEWTGFEIREADEGSLSLRGACVSGRSPGYYANLLSALPAGESRYPQVLPAHTVSALSLSLPDFSSYVKAYERWLDASQSLQKFRRDCDTLRSRTGEDPLKWLEGIGIREVVKASWIASSGADEGVVLVRCAKAVKSDAEGPFLFGAFFAPVFGEVFACEGSSCKVRGEWLVIGPEKVLSEYELLMEEKGSLQDALSEVSASGLTPAKGVRAAFYFSASDARSRFPDWFRPQLEEALTETLEGVVREPLCLTCTGEGLSLAVSRPTAYAERKLPAKRNTPGRKADVEIPAGPFEVLNCGTGKANLFYQAPNLSLCLKDKESGKGLWGVSFDQPICGAVGSIDYFANGKLQFLFAAGSRLYLIDRLGRFVSGFPVELGKEVLLGPAVYDFSGAKGYTVLVLHRDNTLGMYDLHGVQPSSWKGIACEDTILSLPVLAKADGKRVWVVRTAGGERIYDFWGGEPLKGKSVKNVEY